MLLKRLDCINNTKPGLEWAKTKTFLSFGLLPPSMCGRSLHRSAKMHLQGQQEKGINGEVEGGGGVGWGGGKAESISIISASAAWLADVKAEWPRLTVVLQSRGSATTTAWKEGCNRWSWLFECPVICSRFGKDYLDRWCRCPRSPACRYTGVLWWCWCRWRSHRTNSGHWRTRRALRRTKRNFIRAI